MTDKPNQPITFCPAVAAKLRNVGYLDLWWLEEHLKGCKQCQAARDAVVKKNEEKDGNQS